MKLVWLFFSETLDVTRFTTPRLWLEWIEWELTVFDTISSGGEVKWFYEGDDCWFGDVDTILSYLLIYSDVFCVDILYMSYFSFLSLTIFLTISISFSPKRHLILSSSELSNFFPGAISSVYRTLSRLACVDGLRSTLVSLFVCTSASKSCKLSFFSKLKICSLFFLTFISSKMNVTSTLLNFF